MAKRKKKEDRENNNSVHPSRIFQTPNDLLKAWNKYKAFKAKEAEKWLKVQYVGKEGQRVTDAPPVMPLTIKGFYAFCYNHYGVVKHYFENSDGYYDEFRGIVSHIKDDSEDNLQTGGLLNMFNSNLTARITGIVDRQDVTSGDEPLKPESVKYELVLPKEDESESE